jgi:hypothetical protein
MNGDKDCNDSGFYLLDGTTKSTIAKRRTEPYQIHITREVFTTDFLTWNFRCWSWGDPISCEFTLIFQAYSLYRSTVTLPR